MATLRFLSLEAIREFHNGLLDERADVADDSWSDEFVERIDRFVRDIIETGAVLEGYDKRSGAQRILDYWIDQTFRRRRTREVTRLALVPFDAARAVAAEDLPDEAFPFGVFGASPERPEDLLPSRFTTAAECVGRLNAEGLAILVGPRASGRTGVALAGVVPLWLRNTADGSLPRGPDERRIVCYDRPGEVIWPLDEAAAETLVVIDHVEDLFDRKSRTERQDADAWLEQLGIAIRDARSSGPPPSRPGSSRRFLLVIRRDAFHHLEAAAGIGPSVAACSIILSPLEARELTEVIESRASQVRLWFARGLVDQIVSDILGDPAAMPWLRVALRGLWNLRERNRVHWSAYDQLGGARLLERGLEDYYERSSADERERIERLLNRLVLPGLREEDFQCVRLAEADLVAHEPAADAMTATIDALIARGLLSRSPSGPSRGPTIRVVHESFVPRWRRLTQWVAARRDLLEDLLRLVDAASAWRDSNQNVGALWIDQTLINDAIKSLARAGEFAGTALPGVTNENLKLAREFLARSQQYVNWRETVRRWRLAIATAAACVFGGLWLLSEHYRGLALTEQQEAERALGRAHRAERERILGEDDLSGALELLNDSTRHKLARDERQPVVEEASSALLREQLLSPSFSRLIQSRGPYRFEQTPARDGEMLEADERHGAWVASTLSQNGSILLECYQRQLTVRRLLATGAADSRDLVIPTGVNAGLTAVEFRSASLSGDGQSIVAEVVERVATDSNEGDASSSDVRAVYAWRGAFDGEPVDRDEGVRLRLGDYESIQLATVRTEYGTAAVDGAWLLVIGPTSVRNNASNSRELHIWQLTATAESPEPRMVASRVIDLNEQQQVVTSSLLRFGTSGGLNRFRVALALRDPGAGPAPMEVRVWEIGPESHSGELSRPVVLQTSCTNVTNLSWCPANQRFLTITGNRSGDIVELWRVDCADDVEEYGAAPRPLAGPQRVQSFADSRLLAFSGDGSTFITGAKDAAFLWRLERSAETGQIAPRFLYRLPHEADVFSAAFSPDGRCVATGSRDRTARLWNVGDGQRMGAPLRHTEVVTALAFDPNATFLTTIDANFSSGDRTVRVWPLATGNPPPRTIVSISGDSLPALSPDGQAVVRFREYHPLADRTSSVASAPRLESLGRVGDQRASSGAPPEGVAARQLAQARAVRFSENGDHLLTWQDPTKESPERTGDILWEFRVHNLRSREPNAPAVIVLPRIPGPGPWRWAEAVAPTAMAISNEGDQVAIAFAHGAGLADRDSQGVIWLWSRREQRANQSADRGRWDSWSAWRATSPDEDGLHRSPIVSMAFSPNGDKLATASTDDSVCIWSSDLQHHEDRRALQRLRHGADVNDVRFVKGARGAQTCLLVTASSDGKLRVWPCDSQKVSTNRAREFSHRAPLQFGRLSHDGTLAISAGDDGRVKVWNAVSGELTAVLQTGRYVRDLAVGRDGTIWTVSQTPGRAFPPPRPIFPTGWQPVTGGRSLLPPAQIQAWRSRSDHATTRRAAIATLLAARRFASNGQLVDMTPTEYADRWEAVRGALSDLSTEVRTDREQVARTVAECIGRRDWYAARWQLDQWLNGAAGHKPGESLVAAKILKAHVQASLAAEQFDGQQACREFAVAVDFYHQTLADTGLTNDERSELWLRLGWLSEKLGNWGDARSHYTQAIERAEGQGERDNRALAVWYQRRGTCHAELNDFEKAAADFEKSWQLAKADYWRSYEQLYCLALLSLAKGGPSDRANYARRCAELIEGHRKFSERLTHEPSWTPLRESESANAVAALCALAPVPSLNPDDAMALARRAVEMNPDNYFVQSTLGGCRFRQAMRLGPLRSTLVQARADLMAARMKYLAGRQTQLGADSIVGGIVQDDGTPYDWLFLAMVTWQLAELDRTDPKAQHNARAAHALRDEAFFWLEKARQQLRMPASLPRTPGRLPCAPAIGWTWWQRMELQLLLREAETMLRTTGAD